MSVTTGTSGGPHQAVIGGTGYGGGDWVGFGDLAPHPPHTFAGATKGLFGLLLLWHDGIQDLS